MTDFTEFDPADVIAGKKILWRCITHRREPQTVPIVQTDPECRIQRLGWMDETIVQRSADGRVIERRYTPAERVSDE